MQTMYMLCRANLEIYTMDIISISDSGKTVIDASGKRHRTHCKQHSIFHFLNTAEYELQILKFMRIAA